jgi:hypothetical protein
MASKHFIFLGPEPDYFNTFDDQQLKPQLDSQKLGAMHLGASQNAMDPMPVWDGNGGMILSAVRSGGSGTVSSTVYVVPSELAKLIAPYHLRIEVLFDFPNSLNADSTENPETWALALNLKRGTAVDDGTDDTGTNVDNPVGPNCQFHPKVSSFKGVRLTGTEPEGGNPVLDPTKTYTDYRAASTAFVLGANLTRTDLKYGGTASLTLTDKDEPRPQSGNLSPQDFSGTSTITGMAIGIALVNLELPGPPPPAIVRTVSVRLRSFAIWMRDTEIAQREPIVVILNPHPRPDPQVIVPLRRS